jgi:predicted site-specific integrase-resolvase
MYHLSKTDEKIYGLRGLSDFLQVSIPVAQKLQRSGKFPTYVAGDRKFIFKKSEVLAGIKKEKNPAVTGVNKKFLVKREKQK